MQQTLSQNKFGIVLCRSPKSLAFIYIDGNLPHAVDFGKNVAAKTHFYVALRSELGGPSRDSKIANLQA